MTEITELTLLETHQALYRGEFSSTELTQAYLKRSEALNDNLNAYLTLTPELALVQARQADQKLAEWRKDPSQPTSPLLGIPMAIKDVICVAGMRCTCGSRILESFIPSYHATAVERLLAAGVVILGKTNTDEFAMGSSTENSAYGPTHNPWNLAHVPGGSSGGSAAAVAANMAAAALGSDTGGSVRQPAAFCGITGLKPTYGRVSRYGLVAYGSSLDVIGALGRTASDVAAVFNAIAGRDERDATTRSEPLTPLAVNLTGERNLAGLRVGVPEEYFIAGMQQTVEKAVRQAIGALEGLGARAVPVRLPHTEYAVPIYYLIAPAEVSANLARYDGIRYGPRVASETMWEIFRKTRGQKFGAEAKRRIMLGTFALSAGYYDAYYGQAQKGRTLIRDDFERAFEQVDVIAAPVAPTTAFRIGEHGDDPLAMYLEDIFTLPANLAGIPALSFPVGFDEQGLPIGMQLMAPELQEGVLIHTAQVYQKANGCQRIMGTD